MLQNCQWLCSLLFRVTLKKENISLFLLSISNTTTRAQRIARHRKPGVPGRPSCLLFNARKLYPRHLDVIRQSSRPGAPPSPLHIPGSLSPVEPVPTTFVHNLIITQSKTQSLCFTQYPRPPASLHIDHDRIMPLSVSAETVRAGPATRKVCLERHRGRRP